MKANFLWPGGTPQSSLSFVSRHIRCAFIISLHLHFHFHFARKKASIINGVVPAI